MPFRLPSQGNRELAAELLAESTLLDQAAVSPPDMYDCNELAIALSRGKPEDFMLMLEYYQATSPSPGSPGWHGWMGAHVLHDYSGRGGNGMALPLHDKRFPYDSSPYTYIMESGTRFQSLNDGKSSDDFLVIMRAWHGVGPARRY